MHGDISHAQILELKELLLREPKESFDIGFMKKLKKFQTWGETLSFRKNIVRQRTTLSYFFGNIGNVDECNIA